MDRAAIPFLSVVELSGLIAKKEVSPVEATEAYLERIDDLDFKFNAYLTVSRKEAIQAARDAEWAITRGDYLGPMHGIPVAVKDQIWTRGIRTTSGSRFLADFVPDEDATAVAYLKKAGGIILGKTNLSEFAITGFTHRYKTPRNPWNLDMSAGGSSSGSGAATAGFLCATSLGEDTGNSIRRPAAWCNLVGLRPSWGRVSRHGVMTGVWSMDTVGPISRTVEDAAITLGVIAGYDPKDPYTWNTPVPDYRQALRGDMKGTRVGLVTELINSQIVQPEVREAVVQATSVLAGMGACVEEVSIPLATDANAIFATILGVETHFNHRDRIRERLHGYGHDNRIGLLTGGLIPAQVYYKAQKLRSMLRQEVLDALKKYDVLAAPMAGKVTVPIQDDPVVISKGLVPGLGYMLGNTFNLSNAPAISVPCGLSSDHLPIGFQIGGRPGGEETVLKVAHAYEQETTWHTLKPPEA